MEDIYANFWNEKLGASVQYKRSDTVDAATLLMPLLHFISPTDVRIAHLHRRIFFPGLTLPGQEI